MGNCEWCKQEVEVKTLTIDTGPDDMVTGMEDVTICKDCFIRHFGRDCEGSWDKIQLPTYLQFLTKKAEDKKRGML